MAYPAMTTFLRQLNMFFMKKLFTLFLSCWLTIKPKLGFSQTPSSSLISIPLDGRLCFSELEDAAKDFGGRYMFLPLAILHPKSVKDIANTITHIWKLGYHSDLTVAARGHGHSLQGQAQAHNGIVVNMESLKEPIHVHKGEFPYVDASGGELWINILHETLKQGLAPKSWTDYLYLTVGGTLSNAGISGMTFRHGQQISNVHQLEVVTGKGEVVNCSENQNNDLFHSVLGGLGQFGIITRARISLEQAPNMVKWIKVLYPDFTTFARDQEYLISKKNTFDYIEGSVIINKSGILNNWRSSFNPQDPIQASLFKSDGKTLFCLELAKYFNPEDKDIVNKDVESSLTQLRYISSTLFSSEVSYVDFLDRVHLSEVELRAKGLWEVPHPWLNLFIPKSKINIFAETVFGKILVETSNGPILIYPIKRSKWDNRSSVVVPDEKIFYTVSFLSLASGKDSLERTLTLNKNILEFCERACIGTKQYLPHYTTKEEWRGHFGPKWEDFVRRKSAYDPLAILAPGQRIFQRNIP